jgi:septum formation topological specificity factor MinE
MIIIFFAVYNAKNILIVFERIPGNIPGAYVNLESELIRCIKYHVNPETDKIKIKIWGTFKS